jgi:hypothetical protein
MEHLAFILIFILTTLASVMLYLRDQKLFSMKRSILSIFVSLLLQSMTLVAIYRILDFYRIDNTISYYMPNWAIGMFYCTSFGLGYLLQKIFLVSERSIYSLLSLGSFLTLITGWYLGASMTDALNYTIVLSSLSFISSFKRFDTSGFESLKFQSPSLHVYVILQAILLSILSFYFIARLPFLDAFEYLVYFSLLYLNLFQTKSLLLNQKFQPIEITRLLLIFLIESDYVQYFAQASTISWFNLVQFYVVGSISFYLYAHLPYLQKQVSLISQPNLRSKQ